MFSLCYAIATPNAQHKIDSKRSLRMLSTQRSNPKPGSISSETGELRPLNPLHARGSNSPRACDSNSGRQRSRGGRRRSMGVQAVLCRTGWLEDPQEAKTLLLAGPAGGWRGALATSMSGPDVARRLSIALLFTIDEYIFTIHPQRRKLSWQWESTLTGWTEIYYSSMDRAHSDWQKAELA